MNTKVSNCITYIPQDIKLELNNGTLTLKAGSKVYIPNSFESDGTTKKFDIHIISSDKVIAYGSKFNDLVIITDINDNFFIASTSYTVSGDTQPTDISRRNIWYDTTTNKVKTNSPSTSNFETNKSLPIAIVNCIDVNKFTISQVFNGFGYIGSTVFALPGVKGLIPNSRNADGSLKSIEFTLDKVSTRTFTSEIGAFTGYAAFQLERSNFILSYDALNYWTYNEEKNIFESTNETTGFCYISKIRTDSTGKITSFTPKTVFHALDYNDKSTISGWSMPSSRYIDLTLGASGATYTAPANGYFYLIKVAGKDLGYINFLNKTKGISQEYSGITPNTWIFALQEAQKGDVFEIKYTASGDTKNFRFIYAEGEL